MHLTRRQDQAGTDADTEVSEGLWNAPLEVLLAHLGTSPIGLSTAEASRRAAADRGDLLARRRGNGLAAQLLLPFRDPIVLVLIGAAALSIVLRDLVDAIVILAIVALSGVLGFVQERRAGRAVDELTRLVRVHADVRRGGRIVEVPVEDVVPGDVFELRAGDLIPGDGRLLEARDLLVDASALTGEPFPQHARAATDGVVPDGSDQVWLGSHVVSGQGVAVAVTTGTGTRLGRLASDLGRRPRRSAFELGIARFGGLLARITLALSAVILGLNLALGHPVVDALLFSLALAVGLTPQMLPAIVTVSLATGARRMATQRVIVRRLDAIEDFGSLDVLCTDKTGTLTQGRIRLDAVLSSDGEADAELGALAALNAGLQTGFTNPIDAALVDALGPPPSEVRLLDEIPFDFTRKRLAVLVDRSGQRELIVKGAFDHVLAVCARVPGSDGTVPLSSSERHRLTRRFAELSATGVRVLGLATRTLPGVTDVEERDERDLIFRGFLTFTDPPKPGIRETVASLRATGIELRILTGDNRLAAAHIAEAIGVDSGRVVTGAELAGLEGADLARVVAGATVFAEMDPTDKEQVLMALRDGGQTVGYLGDGINDAGALQRADVGISVDTAVDVAKQSAAIVLLDKDLDVLVEGVQMGRQTFANTLKYVFTTVSANFGNVVSMAAASAFLPFLPLLPRQILLLNFLSDIPSTTLAADVVDPEQRARPVHWDIRLVRDFMFTFGLVSTAFDLLIFALLLQVFAVGVAEFRTGWFVGSTLTELAVLLVLRTRRPAYRSRPSRALLSSSVVVAAVALSLPYLPLSDALGLEPLTAPVLAVIGLVIVTYVLTVEWIKPRFFRAVASPRDHGAGA